MTSNQPTTLYRYDLDLTEHDAYLTVEEIPVIKHTRCGVWIKPAFRRKRFVNLQSCKQYASTTKEKALSCFRARKVRQISILKHQLEMAKIGLELAGIPTARVPHPFIFDL